MYISLPRLHPTGLSAWDRHDKCKHILSNNPCKGEIIFQGFHGFSNLEWLFPVPKHPLEHAKEGL